MALVLVTVVPGCGARSEPLDLLSGPRIAPGELAAVDDPLCLSDLDCVFEDRCQPAVCVAGHCQKRPPITCEDDDPCTEDRCVPETGDCEFRPLSLDEDGDGFRGPRPGYAPGAPGACGDDCDDTSAEAFPGGQERCDGVDNDCNGVVDEDAAYLPTQAEAVIVPDEARQSTVGGLTYDGSRYVAGFAAQRQAWQSALTSLSESGQRTGPEHPVTSVNSDTFSGPVVWTGSQLATAWEDRRDGDFEIYFNRFDVEGNKLGPDVRLSNADDFSLRPDVLWDGSGFVVVWGDRRSGPDDYRIYGQRLGPDGTLIGGNVELTPGGYDAEAPGIAQSSAGFGLVFNVEGTGGRQVAFRTMSPDLQKLGDILLLGSPGSVGASIVHTGGRYIVAWSTRDVVPGPSIVAAQVSPEGEVLVDEQPITGPAPFARGQSILPLGDRLLIVWGEERTSGYDLYTKQIGLDFEDLSFPEQVTWSDADVTSPAIAFGPDGDVGVLYEDLSSGSWQVYFTRLSCRPGSL